MNIKTIALAMFVSAAFAAPIAHAADKAAAESKTAVEKTGDYASDAALTTKVKAALLAEKKLKSLPISVETTAGVVTLSGQVISTAQIDQAVDVAKHVKGVRDVHNALELKTETKVN